MHQLSQVGGYDAPDAYAALEKQISAHEAQQHAILDSGQLRQPPLLSCRASCLLWANLWARGHVCSRAGADGRRRRRRFHARVLIEKPFGRDAATFMDLHALTTAHLRDHEIFRLDHYLGKEVILNIPSLRWANQLFEPTWNAQHIESVQLTFKEDLGTGGRGGFFDREGIIRDVVQNHLMQAFMFLAMEPPKTMSPHDVTRAKVDLLRRIAPLSCDAEECFLAQYVACGDEPGYLDDETVLAAADAPPLFTPRRQRPVAWRALPVHSGEGHGWRATSASCGCATGRTLSIA